MSNGIDYFFRSHWLSSIQEQVSFGARRRMFSLWLKLSPKESQTILDVGATPDCERLDSNCFLKWLTDRKFNVSVVSPEDLQDLKLQFPLIKILEPLPFNSGDEVKTWEIPNQSYDWTFSSAVIEHVGDNFHQLHFLKECSRVSRGLFLTTPSRWHWLEFHTKLPLIHWLPKSWHRWILNKLGLEFWSKTQNLNLLSKNELLSLAQTALGDSFEYQIKTIWTLGMPSNLILLASRR